jgi:hypothetical protein
MLASRTAEGQLGEDRQIGVQVGPAAAVRWRPCQAWAYASICISFPELRIPRL